MIRRAVIRAAHVAGSPLGRRYHGLHIQPPTYGLGRLILFVGIPAGIVGDVILNSYTIVPEGYVGVCKSLGDVPETILKSGFHFVLPYSHVEHVPVLKSKP